METIREGDLVICMTCRNPIGTAKKDAYFGYVYGDISFIEGLSDINKCHTCGGQVMIKSYEHHAPIIDTAEGRKIAWPRVEP